MHTDNDLQAYILQDNLPALRRIAGWSTAAAAEKLGITRQSLHNLESKKVSISRIQYIAIRSVFECEASQNAILRKVMRLLFCATPSVYTIHDEHEIRGALSMIAAAVSEQTPFSSVYVEDILRSFYQHTSISISLSEMPNLLWLQEELKHTD